MTSYVRHLLQIIFNFYRDSFLAISQTYSEIFVTT